MKDCLKSDRARIQVGRISPFGLMEMSRQRLRPSFLETSTTICHTCGGSGFVRSIESTALLIIRTLEEEGVRERSSKITVSVHTEVAIYLLNQKRAVIQELENLYGITILILADPTINMNDYKMDREKGKPGELTPVSREVAAAYTASPIAEDEDEEEDEEEKPARSQGNEDEDGSSSKRRRRRRRRKPRDESAATEAGASESQKAEPREGHPSDSDEDAQEPKRRRRGKRGGRRRSRTATSDEARHAEDGEGGRTVLEETATQGDTADDQASVHIPITVTEGDSAPAAEEQTAAPQTAGETADASPDTPLQGTDAQAAEEPVEVKKPRRTRRKATAAEAEPAAETVSEPASSANAEMEEEEKPKKKAPARRRRTTKKAEAETTEADVNGESAAEAKEDASKPASKAAAKADDMPTSAPETAKAPADTAVADTTEISEKPVSVTLVNEGAVEETTSSEAKPKRRGWWRRG